MDRSIDLNTTPTHPSTPHRPLSTHPSIDPPIHPPIHRPGHPDSSRPPAQPSAATNAPMRSSTDALTTPRVRPNLGAGATKAEARPRPARSTAATFIIFILGVVASVWVEWKGERSVDRRRIIIWGDRTRSEPCGAGCCAQKHRQAAAAICHAQCCSDALRAKWHVLHDPLLLSPALWPLLLPIWPPPCARDPRRPIDPARSTGRSTSHHLCVCKHLVVYVYAALSALLCSALLCPSRLLAAAARLLSEPSLRPTRHARWAEKGTSQPWGVGASCIHPAPATQMGCVRCPLIGRRSKEESND
jgi:hypothetical protein